jgi:NADPH:quinone reductase-like Zn-dependent oxidoreductase
MLGFIAFVAADSTPSTMGAWVAEKGYEASYPTPIPGDLHKRFKDLPTECEVIVQIHASSVNPADIYTRTGVMGSDISGTVVELGSGCSSQSRLAVGTEVWGDIGANAHSKPLGTITKENAAYAQYAAALETQLGLKPKNIDFAEAGALPKVSLTSYKALQWYANAGNWTKASTGPVVLVLGGSGGTGTCGIQMAKAFGASKVITTTSADNFDYCKGLGADQLIDYKTQNWWDVLKENSVDIVYDTVGQTGSGNHALTVLRPSTYGGYLVTIAGGQPTKTKAGITANHFINSDTNLDNLPLMDALTQLVESEKLRMKRIDSTYSLQEIKQAFARSSTHLAVGKISISISNATETMLNSTSWM